MADEILKNIEMLPDEVEFVSDLKAIVYTTKAKAYQAADLYNVASNWLVGRRIVEQEQHGEARAQYGKHVIEIASLALVAEFGKGYSIANLKSFRKFYLTFKYLQIGQTASAQSADRQVSNGQTPSVLSESAIQRIHSIELELAQILPANLSWSHYERLMRIADEDERDWYMREAALEGWSVRTLQDLGQMDMYIRMYDELKCTSTDNPTIGLLLCSETSKDLARYSILKDSKQIYTAKYLTYLPTKEQLAAEIIKQKEIFEMQIGKKFN